MSSVFFNRNNSLSSSQYINNKKKCLENNNILKDCSNIKYTNTFFDICSTHITEYINDNLKKNCNINNNRIDRSFLNENIKLTSSDKILQKSFITYDNSNCVLETQKNYNNYNNYNYDLNQINYNCYIENSKDKFNGEIYQGIHLFKNNENIVDCNINNFFKNNYDICLNNQISSSQYLILTTLAEVKDAIENNKKFRFGEEKLAENLWLKLHTTISEASFNNYQYWSYKDILGNTTSTSNMFNRAYLFNADISKWDVGKVTNMNNMFVDAHNFNADISKWDVGKVTNMNGMFAAASSFNKDISEWDVGKVTDMNAMFFQASSFNKDISQWDVGKVTDMEFMFLNASSFNQNLSDWGNHFLGTIGIWGIAGRPIIDRMFGNSKIDSTNRQHIINSWSRHFTPNDIDAAFKAD